jgi:hypothetical protein
MAKVTMPLLSGSASGQFGHAMVFQKNGTARKYVKPSNPQSNAQMAQRDKLADIQATLKVLGHVLRGQLKSGFGARWNSMIIGEITANAGAYLTSETAIYNAFQAGEKTAWDGANTASSTHMAKGLALFVTASAVYEIAQRLSATVTLALPAHANAATVGGQWIAN